MGNVVGILKEPAGSEHSYIVDASSICCTCPIVENSTSVNLVVTVEVDGARCVHGEANTTATNETCYTLCCCLGLLLTQPESVLLCTHVQQH